MNPATALFLLSLTGPLDSKSFAVRESARKQLDRMEPADCMMVAPALMRAKSIEVAESARRYVESWPAKWYAREVELLSKASEEYRLSFMAVYGPYESKPWQALHKLEMSIAPDKQKEWAIRVWKTIAKPMLDQKHKADGTEISVWGNTVAIFDMKEFRYDAGLLAGTLWHIRIIEQNGGIYASANSKEW